ncbi:hypothetical protein ScPMuIL_012875 [Solemya velum]
MLRIAGLLVVVAAICVCEGYKNQKLKCKSSPRKPRTCIPGFPSAGTWIKRAKVIKSMCKKVPCVLNENYWIERFHIRVSSGCKAKFLVEFEEITCGPPPLVANMESAGSSTTFGSMAVYSCKGGSTSSGCGGVLCLADGTWSPLYLTCKIRDEGCGTPEPLTNAVLEVTSNTAKYTCLDGYATSGSGDIVCQADGSWSTHNLRCSKIVIICEHNSATVTCPDGEMIDILSANYGRTEFETCPHSARSDLQCVSGSAVTENVRSCNNRNSCTLTASNGIFGDPCHGTFKYLNVTYDCLERDEGCGTPEPLTNAVLEVTSNTAKYTCLDGYATSGSGDIVCQADGSWSTPNLRCSKNVIICEHDSVTVTCPDGEMIDILSANYGRTEFETCPHSARSDLQCVSGSAVTENVRSCNNRNSCTLTASNGIFGDPCHGTFKYLNVTYDCLDRDCGTPEPLANADLEVTSNTAKYTCLDGYATSGSGDIVCQADGSWSTHNLRCSKIVIICEHNSATVTCPDGEMIDILSANYGRTEFETCPHSARSDLQCVSGSAVTENVRSCNNRNSCTLTASNGIFGDPCHGTFKYLNVTYDCLERDEGCGTPEPLTNAVLEVTSNTAKYTCLDGYATSGSGDIVCQADGSWSTPNLRCSKNVIICEHDSATVTCPDGEMIDILSANYGRTEFETCPHSARSDLQCVSGSAVTENVRSCNNRNSCALTASNGIFGDTCYGTFKYLNVTYDCLETKISVTCEHDTASLSCPAGETIHIVAVNYGRTDGVTCPHTSIKDTDCLSGPAAANIVKTKCNDKNSCIVDVDNGVIGGDPCVGTYKYLTVSYNCL